MRRALLLPLAAALIGTPALLAQSTAPTGAVSRPLPPSGQGQTQAAPSNGTTPSNGTNATPGTTVGSTSSTPGGTETGAGVQPGGGIQPSSGAQPQPQPASDSRKLRSF